MCVCVCARGGVVLRRSGALTEVAVGWQVGAFLYRWVHSLHHKSYNPGRS